MTRFSAGLLDLFDPRGRINRVGLLAVAIVLLALEIVALAIFYLAGGDSSGPLIIVLKLLFTWLATAAVIKRLHDLGLGASTLVKAALAIVLWSVVLSAALMILLGDAAMAEGEIGFWLSVGGTVAPVLVLILWLHVARGMAGPNTYGPEPPAFHVWSRRTPAPEKDQREAVA
jgi:uncharacterized membrane protein YhaH (DUF805 family)